MAVLQGCDLQHRVSSSRLPLKSDGEPNVRHEHTILESRQRPRESVAHKPREHIITAAPHVPQHPSLDIKGRNDAGNDSPWSHPASLPGGTFLLQLQQTNPYNVNVAEVETELQPVHFLVA